MLRSLPRYMCWTAPQENRDNEFKLSAVALLAIIVPAQARTATLTDAEATFLDQLVTAATVLERRCTGYEVNGTGASNSAQDSRQP